jgi:hypothetical protein
LTSSKYCLFDKCIWFHSFLCEMHILGRNSYYIGLLNSFFHFGNRCQWGRSLEGLREIVFILKFGLCLSVLPFMHLFFVRCFAWLNI